MSLLVRLLDFSQKNGLLPPGARLLVAVSGGVDSVALAHLLAESGAWPLALAHCNFQLRGAESDGDAAFVCRLAADLGCPFFEQKFDTQAFAAENSLSIQVAARQLRYAWFEEIRAAEGCDLIAIAHNLDDSVETSIFNLLRSTGLAGLQGIPARNGMVVRPLLFAQRVEIEAFARAKNIAWREDSSNAADDYARNFIRHHILPRMADLNPNVLETVARMQARVGEAAANEAHFAEQFFAQNLRSDEANDGIQRIDKQAIARFPSPKHLLFKWLRPHGFSEEQVRQMAENLSAPPGMEWRAPDGVRVVLDRTELLLVQPKPVPQPVKIEADDLLVSLPDGSKMSFFPLEMPQPPADFLPQTPAAALVSAENLRYPLLLRRWRAGDTFQPLGMGGRSQKLQDFFTNQKLSRPEKDRIWLLENGAGEVIWVVGQRLDERFKILPTTRKALKINWIKSE